MCDRTVDAQTGNDLVSTCKMRIEAYDTNKRMNNDQVAYNMGICDGTLIALGAIGPTLPVGLRFCPPTDATVQQSLRVVINYLDAHPARLHEPFVDLTITALRDVWPCK
ncbi:Rap1a/Tai family immunity protein [Bradyrhizobium sp.]|uniref:Rap1a/Tai family immunity protein n=1 Tax=Bradyrhizobium sp. TaxID=376 RepID=UPI00345CC1CF